MRKLSIVTALLLFASSSILAADKPQPATTNNNDSCDIAVLPAATLLLPYFEVETTAAQGAGTTTLFTITNTSRYPQIARVTVWTDWAFPVLAYDIFLTGYDVQGINLFDVLVRGIIAPTGTGINGTSITTVPGRPDPSVLGGGTAPLSNTSNPNFVTSGALDVSQTCLYLAGLLTPDLVFAVRNALTTGIAGNAGTCRSTQVGSNTGTRAKGYLTVDVVSYCSKTFPTDLDGSYFAGPTAPLLFDNVLLGDYQTIGPTPTSTGTTSTFDAQGSPMVHIRAMPEGGLSGAGGGSPVETNLPFSFYDRYTPTGARTADRRQPLPSVWAAHFIQGGGAPFATNLKIWREGLTSGRPDCAGVNGVERNRTIQIANVVRFDEHENSYGWFSGVPLEGYVFSFPFLPAASRTSTDLSAIYPVVTGTDIGGWIYLNLNSGALDAVERNPVCRAVLSAQRPGFGTCFDAPPGSSGSRTTSQNWVVTSWFGPVGTNRLSVDFDAMALGNGCTPASPFSATVAPSSHPSGSLLCPANAKPEDCSPATRPARVNP